MKVLSERTVAEVREGSVTVRKAMLDLGREAVTGVKLTIESSSDHPVEVELVEGLPSFVTMADVQVHPSYHPEKWRKSTEDHQLIYEDELPPGGERETIYGVRVDPVDADALAEEPHIESVRELSADEPDRPADPPDTIEDTVETTGPGSDSGDPPTEPSASGAEASASPSSTQGATLGEPVVSNQDRPGPADPEPTQPTPFTRGGSAVGHEATVLDGPADDTNASVSGGSRAESEPPDRADDGAFTFGEDRGEPASLDSDEIDMSDLLRSSARLRRPPAEGVADDADADADASARAGEMSVGLTTPAPSTDDEPDPTPAMTIPYPDPDRRLRDQLSHPQSDVARLSGFAEEFEAFVDAIGSPAEAMTEMRSSIELLVEEGSALDARLDDVVDEVASVAQDRDRLEDHLDEVATKLRAGDAERQALRDRVDDLDDGVRDGAESRDAIHDRLTDLAEEVRGGATARAELRERTDELEDRLRDRTDELADELREAEEERTALHREFEEFSGVVESLGEVRNDIHDHLSELTAATRAIADERDSVRDRVDRLERDLEARRESLEASLDRLDERLGELESMFDSDEATALQEVIAAEHRWRQHQGGLHPAEPLSRSPELTDG